MDLNQLLYFAAAALTGGFAYGLGQNAFKALRRRRRRA